MTRQDVEAEYYKGTADNENDYSFVDTDIVKDLIDDVEDRVNKAKDLLVKMPPDIINASYILANLSEDLY